VHEAGIPVARRDYRIAIPSTSKRASSCCDVAASRGFAVQCWDLKVPYGISPQVVQEPDCPRTKRTGYECSPNMPRRAFRVAAVSRKRNCPNLHCTPTTPQRACQRTAIGLEDQAISAEVTDFSPYLTQHGASNFCFGTSKSDTSASFDSLSQVRDVTMTIGSRARDRSWHMATPGSERRPNCAALQGQ